jgi:hypothetical protein
MTRCDVQGTGAIELYFYDELEPDARASIERHLRGCHDCAHALEELRVIREALASRPEISAPETGDWSAFMARLDGAIAGERRRNDSSHDRGRGYVAYLAMAAVLALATIGVTVALRSRPAPQPSPAVSTTPTVPATVAATAENPVADFEAISEEHFERSKLVVLGLATKDAAQERSSDWAYERELASSLLDDTRMYRLAAQDRGLTDIASVMRDLEVVLLQTSMTDDKDPAALRQIQRFIQKRDLLEKMDEVAVPAAGRTMRTKGI